MNQDSYGDIAIAHDFQAFLFVSTGINGRILKGVAFTPTPLPDAYYMTLGDIEHDGQLNDIKVSNNGDRNKILATIVRIISIYTDKYPERSISFRGSSKGRTRLYRMAIGLHLEELSEKFDIKANVSESTRFIPFQKNMEVFEFLIKRKVF